MHCYGLSFNDTSYEPIFDYMPKLWYLHIRSCGIIEAPNITGVGNSLINLNLFNNNIAWLPEDYFYGCRKLRDLNLSENYLQGLPDMTYLSNSLRIISADRNQIESLEPLMEAIMLMLESLHVSRNRLTTVELLQVFDYWPLIKDIHIFN